MTDAQPVSVVAVGDIMLGRDVRHASLASALDLLTPEVRRCLKGDIVTANLECVIGSSGSPSPLSHSHFRTDPEFARSLLQHFDVVSLANNHIGDYGDEAIDETLTWLAAYGVRPVGIGLNASEATAPAIFHVSGHKVAVFGATSVGMLTPKSRYTVAEPGASLFRRVSEFIISGHTCVLHLHAGGGDVCYPSPTTRRLLNEAAAAGFHVVLGHHPHVVQGYVASPRGAVFYSLGDFLFDRIEGGRDTAMLVELRFDPSGASLSTEIQGVRRSSDLRLEMLEGEALRVWRTEIHNLSEGIRTRDSDRHYRAWQGGRIKRILKSIARDYRAGGVVALNMKIRRVMRRALLMTPFTYWR